MMVCGAPREIIPISQSYTGVILICQLSLARISNCDSTRSRTGSRPPASGMFLAQPVVVYQVRSQVGRAFDRLCEMDGARWV